MAGYELLLIPLGFLLGAIPSAMIVYKAVRNVDLCTEGDGHISATAVYRRAGLIPFITVVIMDLGKGALATFIGGLCTQETLIILAAGIMAMIGHCWSPFIKFRGGLGGTVMIGVLFGLAWWQLLICIAVIGIIFFITRKSTLATILLAVFMAAALFITRLDILSGIFPLVLLMVQVIKRLSLGRSGNNTEYKNDLFKDLKRIK